LTTKFDAISKEIELDITRTCTWHADFGSLDAKGSVLLKRVLLAYAFLDEEIGYRQGMNYLAALVLIRAEFDITMAFAIFETLMRGERQWRKLYYDDCSTVCLVVKQVIDLLNPILHTHLQGLPLTCLLAGPILGFFSHHVYDEMAC